MAAGGLTRRQEVNRLANARALLGDAKVNWKQAEKLLSDSQKTVLNQFSRMTDKQKQDWAYFNRSDYKASNDAWRHLAQKNPDRIEEIKSAQRLAQLKLAFGKDMLTNEQYKAINAFLSTLEYVADDFGVYWGYGGD